MTIIKNQVKYFEDGNRIKLTFKTSNDRFTDYSDIFYALSEIDRLSYLIQNNIKFEKRFIKLEYNSKVISISKNSPFFIDLFSNIHWHEYVILFISLTKGQIVSNVKQNIEDFNKLMDLVEETFIEIASDFTDTSREFVASFLRYYFGLDEAQKQYLINKIMRIRKALNKIISIKK